MKKHMGGFVPVDYQKAGKVLIISGLIVSILSGLSQLLNASFLKGNVIFLGLGLIIVGSYLIKYTPKD